VTLTAVQSDDLQSWSTDGVIDELDPAAPVLAGTEARRARIPILDSGRRFFCLQATTR
jgi:hypothetical protein